MKYIILFLLAIIPVILISGYVYLKDKNKEPAITLAILFFCGILSCPLVIVFTWLLEQFFPVITNTNDLSMIGRLIYCFVVVALLEEGTKWFFVRTIGYTSKEFDEIYDILVYAVFVSLGFATLENFIYIFHNLSIQVGIIRGFFSIPGHACDAVFMGYYMSIAKLYQKKQNRKKEREYLIYSLLFPIAIHGFFDFCLISNNNVLYVTFLIFITFLYILSILKIRDVSLNNRKLELASERQKKIQKRLLLRLKEKKYNSLRRKNKVKYKRNTSIDDTII